MDMLHELVALALHASLLLLALGIGLDIARGDGLYVLRRPRLLLRALLAVAVVVPLVAALLVALLPLKESVEIAIVLMAVSPLPPIVLAKEIRFGGRKPYAYGLLVAVALLSIVTVPAAVAILAWLFDAHAAVAPL
ncbi:MAG TPA: Na+-dependent transporter, partial [Massilia timonae]|nr:Na+-dependent transporter [Massilia timonae]